MTGRRSEGRDPSGETPLDVLWHAPTLARILLAGEVLALVVALSQSEGDRVRGFLLASLAIAWIILLTLAVLYLLRHELARWRPVRVASLAMLLLIVSTWVVFGVATLLNGEVWRIYDGRWPGALGRMTAMAVAVGALALAMFRNHWAARQAAIQAQRAQLEALRARIRPHFLFNSLNTAVALVRDRPQAAEAVLLDLSDLFRTALDAERDVPLAHELAMTRRYLDIEKLRLGDRLRLEWDVADPVPAAIVPSLVIQPLAENAVRHGIEAAPGGGTLRLDVSREGNVARIRIVNPMPAGRDSPPGHRIGLASARARIAALGHRDASIAVAVEGDQHVVTVRLPILA